jgi:hypothetical protein
MAVTFSVISHQLILFQILSDYCMYIGYIDVVILIILFYLFAERVGAKVVECACVIELPELKVFFASIFQSNNFLTLVHHVGIVCMTLSGVSICLLVAFWFLTVCFRTLSSSSQV